MENKRGSYTVSYQNVKATPLSFSKADAKVDYLIIQAKYIILFLEDYWKVFLNMLIMKGVIKHKKRKRKRKEKEEHIIIYNRGKKRYPK